MARKKRGKPPKEDVEKANKAKAKIDYPLFCFKYLNTNKSIKGNNDEGFSFITRAQKLCELGWNEIHKSHKHSFGYEKIPINKLKIGKGTIPNIVTPDVKHLYVF